MKITIAHIWERLKASTPVFFKKIQIASGLIGGACVAALSLPDAPYYPSTFSIILSYGAAGSAISIIISQLTVTNPEDLKK